MYTLERYALVDYLERTCDGHCKSADMVDAFISTGWKSAVLKFDNKRQARSTAAALRSYIRNHDEPIICSMVGGIVVLERTDLGY